MTATIIRLPTARTSYLTVRKSGARHLIELVTPCGSRPLRTAVASTSDLESARAYARERAAAMQLPFKIGGKPA